MYHDIINILECPPRWSNLNYLSPLEYRKVSNLGQITISYSKCLNHLYHRRGKVSTRLLPRRTIRHHLHLLPRTRSSPNCPERWRWALILYLDYLRMPLCHFLVISFTYTFFLSFKITRLNFQVCRINASQFIGAPLYLINEDWYDAWIAFTKESWGLLIATMTQCWAPTIVRVSGDKSVRGQILQSSEGDLLCKFPSRLILIANHQVSLGA